MIGDSGLVNSVPGYLGGYPWVGSLRGDEVCGLVGDQGEDQWICQGQEAGSGAGERLAQVSGKATTSQADGGKRDQDQAAEHDQALAGAVEGLVVGGKAGDIGKDKGEQDGGEGGEGFG